MTYPSSRYFVTGANGFVGKHLCHLLSKLNISYLPGVQKSVDQNQLSYGDLNLPTDWEKLLANQSLNVVIHLVARVHVMNEDSSQAMPKYLKLNTEATVRLATAAKKLGIRKFIFISSIKVNGEKTFNQPFTADEVPHPEDAYGISKYKAEVELMKLHEPGLFEVVIIRAPLIYGPEVKANFAKLFNLVQRFKILPFGAVHNKRSLLSVYNLCDLIVKCAGTPEASGQIFLASDDADMSLKQLTNQMAEVQNRRIIQVPIPVSIFYFFARLLRKKLYVDRLVGNLHVDIEKTKSILGWRPKYNFQQSLKGLE